MHRITLVIALALALSATYLPAARAEGLPPGEDATVSRVIDGDTVQVVVNGKRFTVRYIGVDSPESKKPGTPVQCFARESTAFNRALAQGRKVRMESDVNNVDTFGRLMRYIYLDDGRMVNEEITRAGYALAATYPPDVKYQARLAAAQQVAVSGGLGLWTACGSSANPAVPAATSAPPPIASTAEGCEPSYPTICIPIGSADLDCPDIPHRRFEVRAPDPHRFDGDHDGIGCEK
jgi:micrococcal nuclease